MTQSQRDDYIYDSFIHTTNDLSEKGFEQLEVLQFMRDFIKTSIETMEVYDQATVDELIKIKQDLGLLK